MDYSIGEVASFIVARENLTHALKNFNEDPCRETDTRLMTAITTYEHEVPLLLRSELGLVKGEDDLAAQARLRLEQHCNARFAYDK